MKNNIKEGLSHLWCRVGMLERSEMAILGKTIDNHKNGSATVRLWKAVNEVHGDSRPNLFGNGQGLQQTGWLGGFSFVTLTNVTIFDEGAELLLHVRPVKNRLNTLQTLVIPFMRAVMEFCDYGHCCGVFSLEVDPIFEVDKPYLHVPWPHLFILLNACCQGLEIRIVLNFLLDRYYRAPVCIRS